MKIMPDAYKLKSVQNPEILVNIFMSTFKDIASYKFTKIRWDNGKLPVYSLSA